MPHFRNGLIFHRVIEEKEQNRFCAVAQERFYTATKQCTKYIKTYRVWKHQRVSLQSFSAQRDKIVEPPLVFQMFSIQW